MRPLERVITVGGVGWLLRKTTSNAHELRTCIYSIVIELLENDQLSRLRACSQCEQIFVAQHGNEKTCGIGCKKKLKDAGSNTRMRQFRQRQNERADAEGRFKLAKLVELVKVQNKRKKGDANISDLVDDLPELRHAKQILGERSEDLMLILASILQGKITDAESAWESLPQRQKRACAALSFQVAVMAVP